MKKTLFILLGIIFCIPSAYTQDTLCVYTKKSSLYDSFYPHVYKLSNVDSVSFSDDFDSLTIHVDQAGFKFSLIEIDSINFRKPVKVDYTTPEGFDLVANSAYSYLKYWYGKEEGMAVSEMGTDLWTAGSETFIATSGTAGENKSIILYSNLNSTNINLTRIWRQFYAGVNTCNIGIKIVNDKGFASTDPRYIRSAELRFLRAFYNWHIVETWGGVHLATEPFYTPLFKYNSPLALFSTSATNSPVSSFYDLIISDLQFAIAHLPPSTSEYGRVTKSVAKAFLSRVYLTRGYIANSTSDFSLARDLATDVMDDGFSLLPNYQDLWDVAKEKNSEVIWSVVYDTDFLNKSDAYNDPKNPYGYGSDIFSAGGNPSVTRGSNNLHPLYIPGYDRRYNQLDNVTMMRRDVRNGWPFIRFKPTKHLLSLYDRSKDMRYQGSWQTVWKVNYAVPSGRLAGKIPYKDTAFVIDFNPTPNSNYFTVSWDTLYNPDGSSKSYLSGQNIIGNQLFPALLKHMDSTRSSSPNDVGNGNIQSAKDVYVIRLAEMYAIAAEAEFQLGNSPQAANHINVLRSRAALPGQLAAMQITEQEISLDFILDERAREFAGEQIRWFDLKRTGKLIPRIQTHNPDVGANVEPYHILRPIPQYQLDLPGGLIQNNGYVEP